MPLPYLTSRSTYIGGHLVATVASQGTVVGTIDSKSSPGVLEASTPG